MHDFTLRTIQTPKELEHGAATNVITSGCKLILEKQRKFGPLLPKVSKQYKIPLDKPIMRHYI